MSDEIPSEATSSPALPTSPPAESPSAESPPASRKWRPLAPRQRRVLGVLVEKAKTTPDAYPMSVNGIVAGCNQKSNRSPVMNLSQDDVDDILIELREMGAVAEVQQGGRVPRYRHYMYDWLGVDKFELAVMTELMLRGEQTVGELRGRASRMEPIADLQALRGILQSLQQKELLLPLTPEGRGQIVTHNLYKDREKNELNQRFAGAAASADDDQPATSPRPEGSGSMPSESTPAASEAALSRGGVTMDMFAELQLEVAELRAEVARLRDRLDRLEN